jgi:signal peptidase I
MFIGNFRTYLVFGESDLPSFASGDKIIINRSAYDITIPFSDFKFKEWRKPERGDMVLCYFDKSDKTDFWLKRIIGLPGDTVQIKKNNIFINRQQLKYEIIKKETFNSNINSSLGELIAVESGKGMDHFVTFSESENILSTLGR